MSFSREDCVELIINSFGKVLSNGGGNIKKRINSPIVYEDGFKFIEEYILYNSDQLYNLVTNPIIEKGVYHFRKMKNIVRQKDDIYTWTLDFLEMYKHFLPMISGLKEDSYKLNSEFQDIFNEPKTKIFCIQLLQSYPVPFMY